MLKRLCIIVLVLLPALVSAQKSKDEIFQAVRRGDISRIRELLDSGVDVNTQNRYGATPLFFAVDKGNAEVVKLLLDQGARANTRDTFYGATPLLWAMDKGNVQIIRMLVDAGADDIGEALIAAVQENQDEVVRVLLEAKQITADELSDALAAATASGNTEIATILTEAGAKSPPKVDIPPELLNNYSGYYKNEEGREIRVAIQEEKLELRSPGIDTIPMTAVDHDTFKPDLFGGFTITFNNGAEQIDSFTVNRQDGTSSVYERISETAKQATNESSIEEEKETKASSSKTETAKKNLPPRASSTAKPIDQNWPQFRGKFASGVGDGLNPPIEWNAAEASNIKWKTAIPGLAHSSPITWGDRVFVTTAISSDPTSALRHGLYGDVTPHTDVSRHTWKIYCLDRRTGKVLWERVAAESVPRVKRHPKSSQANSTPATDGKHVVVLFGSGDLMAYDFDGKLLWKQDLGVLDAGWFYDPDYQWGYGSSPIIFENLVIVQCDLQKDSYLAAFDLSDGSRKWFTPREEIPSWGTPTIYRGKNRVELIANGTNHIRGYDPRNGKELWRLSGNSEITVPTPIAGENVIYVTSGYRPIQPIYAIRPGASGDISLKESEESNEFISWSRKRGGPYMPTPIIYGEYLYTVANNGVVTCYHGKTGEEIYQQRLGGRGSAYAFSASPVAAEGRLYFTSEDGEIFVVKAGPEFEILSVNRMEEVCMATPAIANQMLIVRTQHHVYGISETK